MPILFKDLPDQLKVELLDWITKDIDFSEIFRLKDIRIDGIEVTQSIQYYNSDQHLSSPATRGIDNAVVLAAFKPAWVRTYVRTGRISPLPGVRGTLTVERRRRGFLWDVVTTLRPQGLGSVTARPSIDYDTERGNTFNSLNFIIPAADCFGILRLTVQVTDAGGAVFDSSSVVVHATLKQTLRLRGIMIAYSGPSTATMVAGAAAPPNITLAAPTVANLQTTAGRALLAMPVQSSGSFALASQITFNLPLDDPRSSAGACSPNWDTLLTRLVTERTNDGNRSDVVYYGLLPAAMPISVPGCGQNGVGAGVIGDAATLLHEIGHGYGFDHTPCGAAGATDPNYPDYKPYASASIGEYGLDISNGTVFPPATTRDFMSYCFPQWMSLYQHGRLQGHTRLDPRWVGDSPIWDQYIPRKKFKFPDDIPDPLLDPDPWRIVEMRREPVVSIIGAVRSAKEIEVVSVARVRVEPTSLGQRVALQARLVDADGRELARAPLYELVSHGGCGCGCSGGKRNGEPPYTFQAMIPDVAVGHALQIGGDDEVLWERSAPDRRPSISKVRAKVVAETVDLTWEASASGDQLEAWVQWSNREGKVWHGLATGLTERRASVNLAPVPSGDALLRVLLHDGFHTVVSDPVPVTVPRRPPAIAIYTPEEGQVLYSGSPMRLWGTVTDSSGATGAGETCRWLLDGREVGRETDLWLSAPTPGEHEATLIATADGLEGRTTATFTTIGGYREEC